MLTRTLAVSCVVWVGALTPLSIPSGALAQSGPVIEDVEPTSGPPGTLVHVSGRRFSKDASVSIAGQPLPVLERLQNRLSVRIAEGSPSGHLAVTGDNGAVRGPEFRVTPAPPAPVIEALEPNKGAPGAHVVLRGKNFSSRLTGNVVTLSGRPVLLRAATPSALELTVPQGAQSGSFVVQVSGLETKSASFEVLASTVIDNVSPARAAPGGELTIRGQGFSAVADKNRVYLANVKLQVKRASERELVVVLPAKVASGELLVDVEGGGRVTAKSDVLVQLLPTVASFAPRKGATGSVVTLRGTGFGSDASVIEVKLGEQPLTVRSVKGTLLEVEVPPGTKSDRFALRVNGVGPALSEQTFEVLGGTGIKSVTPESGAVASEVVIEGQGFAPAVTGNRVRIGGKIAPVLEASPTKLRVRVPDGVGGKVEVLVQGSAAAMVAPRPFVTAYAK